MAQAQTHQRFHDDAAPEAVRIAEIKGHGGHLPAIESDFAPLASFLASGGAERQFDDSPGLY
jgi:hypothetical protein